VQQIPFPNERVFIFETKGSLFQREISRASALKRMIAAVKEYQPDIIYLRFGLYSYPLHHIFEIAPVALEINSNDIDEYRSRGMFFYWFNRITRNVTFSLVAGLTPVSHELALRNAVYKKKVSVISNGIDLQAYSPIPAPNNKTPVLTIIGSPGMNWHGMDKLFPLARKFPDLDINIIGYGRGDFSEPIPENIFAHGYLGHNEIQKILSETDVVFGTLALHRKNMNEVPPLKIREALAYGIPVIIAYKDTDLDEIQIETVLKISNTETNVMDNAEKIRNFAYAMCGKRVDVNAIDALLDQRVKEQRRLAFFADIIKSAAR